MSSAVKFNSSLKLLRNISHELRKTLNSESVKSNDSMVYILDTYRRHDVTDRRVCRPKDELRSIAETYLCYLNSSRNYRLIYDKFYSKGERSVAETARMVGFILPENVDKNH